MIYLQVVQNCDELFDREEFSAAPDAGWPDCFNSGVFVFVPSINTYEVIQHGLTQNYFRTRWKNHNYVIRLAFPILR